MNSDSDSKHCWQTSLSFLPSLLFLTPNPSHKQTDFEGVAGKKNLGGCHTRYYTQFLCLLHVYYSHYVWMAISLDLLPLDGLHSYCRLYYPSFPFPPLRAAAYVNKSHRCVARPCFLVKNQNICMCVCVCVCVCLSSVNKPLGAAFTTLTRSRG